MPSAAARKGVAAACLLLAAASSVCAGRNITCDADPGVDHAYGDLGKYIENVKTTADCCSACQKNAACVAWVLETDLSYCFLKAQVSNTPCSRVAVGSPCRRSMAARQSMRLPPSPTPPPPPPPPAPHHFLPVYNLSAKFRNWSYFVGPYDGFVVPPLAGNFSGQTLTDTPVAYEKTPEDPLPGRWRMNYLWFNGTKGGNGYEAGLAVSDDLLHWRFGLGGEQGLVFKRNPTPGTYDYGGVTLGGMLYQSASLEQRRLMQKHDGKYWSLYGCYPSRDGYEAGGGGEGIAFSVDGVVWQRYSDTVPIIPKGSPKLQPWESGVVYQPYLVESNGTLWDFYNARGTNEYGAGAEETGVQNLPLADLPGLDAATNKTLWKPNAHNPVIPSGPPGSCDSNMASDPKVYWDEEQQVWVMIYFGVGAGTGGHADILIAFSTDLVHWDKDERPLYRAGGHPSGIDSQHAHKVSLIYDDAGVGYLYYTAVGHKGRGIGLLTSKPFSFEE